MLTTALTQNGNRHRTILSPIHRFTVTLNKSTQTIGFGHFQRPNAVSSINAQKAKLLPTLTSWHQLTVFRKRLKTPLFSRSFVNPCSACAVILVILGLYERSV